MEVLIILTIMLGPPLILWYIGNNQKVNGNKEKAKIYYIVASVYLIIGLGICGSLLCSFSSL